MKVYRILLLTLALGACTITSTPNEVGPKTTRVITPPQTDEWLSGTLSSTEVIVDDQIYRCIILGTHGTGGLWCERK